MTNYEIQKVGKETAKCLRQLFLEDDELLDAIFPPRFMSIHEASEFTGIPVNTLYQKVSEIPHSKKCGRLIFTDRALARWLTKKDSVSVTMEIQPALRKVM